MWPRSCSLAEQGAKQCEEDFEEDEDMPSNLHSHLMSPSLGERIKSTSVRSSPSRRVLETRSEATLASNRFPFGKRTWRIIVMGSPRVGKTSFLSRFIYKKFGDGPSRNLDEMHRLDFEIANQRMTAEILDTSGYNNFPAMQEVAIRQADCFILVFAVDSEESLETLKDLRQEIVRIKQLQQRHGLVPMVVLANKMDLELPQRRVDLDYVEFLVKCDWENCGLAKASAKCDYGVQECFKELLLCSKSPLPSNTPVRRIHGALNRMHSAPAGSLRTDANSTKFPSPKLLQKFRDRERQKERARATSPVVLTQEDECLIS